jgi:hypothetical protein
MELSDGERWTCSHGCGQVYRVSSSRSIHKHLLGCKNRPSMQPAGGEDNDGDASIPALRTAVVTEDGRTSATEGKVDRPLPWRIPSQVDGLEDDTELVPEDGYLVEALRYENSFDALSSPCRVPSPHPPSTLAWEDAPLRILLRRQQLETEDLSARHFMEIAALQEELDTSLHMRI